MNVVLNLGMGCVRGAIDRDWAHPYLISAPFLLTHSFPDPPVCHDTLAWVLGTGAFLPVSILWIFQFHVCFLLYADLLLWEGKEPKSLFILWTKLSYFCSGSSFTDLLL